MTEHDRTAYYCTLSTPIGRFSVAVDASRSVIATAFGGTAALAIRLRGGTGPGSARLVRSPSLTAAVREQIDAYFRGDLRRFTVPLAPAGTGFQQRVWKALLRIPFGRTRSYGEIARELRSSARAVGRANATNPVCLIVPCHRVIGADGSLTGFAFGEDVKRRLLEHEARPRTRPSSPGP